MEKIKCIKCCIEKPRKDYYKNSTYKSGYLPSSNRIIPCNGDYFEGMTKTLVEAITQANKFLGEK